MTPGLTQTWRGSNLTTTGYYTPGVQSTGGQSCDRPGVTLLNSENVGQAGCRGFGYNRFQKQDGNNGTLNINVPIVQTGAFKHSWSGACEGACSKADCYGYLFDDSEITLELIESLINGINKEGLDNLTEYFKNIGICCISKLQTKRLQHDILVSYHRKDSDLPALVFYETETSIVHVKNRKGIFTIKDIPDK